MSERLKDLISFYDLLERLKHKNNNHRFLSSSDGYIDWPQKGVYFFMEDGENRTNTGRGLRIVRIGTHALKDNSKTTLWKRLSQHRGTKKTNGGNHRGSIFRLLIGVSILKRDNIISTTWDNQVKSPDKATKEAELIIEQNVSDFIRKMPFLTIEINDASNAESLRGYIERNSIALLSNWEKTPLDPPSKNWLGLNCNRIRVKKSGLWNQNHVNENYDPDFLTTFEKLITDMKVIT